MKVNVLLADDHKVIRLGSLFLVKEVFGNPVIREAGTWQDTVNTINEHPIDLVILDIEIPGGLGVNMIPLLKTRKTGLKVLMLTASDEAVYALRYLDQGANGFIQKSAGEEELKKAIQRVYDGKQYISSAVKEMILENRLTKGKQTSVNPFELLSNRELEVCRFLLKGYRLGDIAKHLQLHTSTVGTYKNNIFEKLQVNNLRLLLDKFQLYK
jgi:two-component system, NarL family, invasion response regulator UvrY